jgi:ABC-type lipoprotein export system ATPase subunit
MHSALQVNPGSEWLEKNQETLWKEMSAGERQRAAAYR